MKVSYRGLNHVALVTGDMDRTILFWRDLLGLRLVAGTGKKGYRQYFFELSEGHYISFFEWKGAQPIEEKDPGFAQKGPIAFDHICLEVTEEEMLWELKARLEAQDIWVTEVLDHGFIISFFTFDPNGICVEVSFSKGTLSDEPRMVDPDASELTLEGPEPQESRWFSSSAEPVEKRRVYRGELKKLFEGTNRFSPPHRPDD